MNPLPDAPPTGTIIRTEQSSTLWRAEIVSLGPEVTLPELRVGTVVLCNHLMGTAIADRLLVPQSAIVAIL